MKSIPSTGEPLGAGGLFRIRVDLDVVGSPHACRAFSLDSRALCPPGVRRSHFLLASCHSCVRGKPWGPCLLRARARWPVQGYLSGRLQSRWLLSSSARMPAAHFHKVRYGNWLWNMVRGRLFPDTDRAALHAAFSWEPPCCLDAGLPTWVRESISKPAEFSQPLDLGTERPAAASLQRDIETCVGNEHGA